jgi:hypothetical protein
MATYGVVPNPIPEPAIDAWDMPLPNETYDQYLYRLYNSRQYEQNRQLQDSRRRVELDAQAAQRRSEMMADRAYQAAQLRIGASRNQMELNNLNYQDALNKDRERNTRVGSVTQSYRNALGGY